MDDDEITSLFKIMSDRTRIEILKILSERDKVGFNELMSYLKIKSSDRAMLSYHLNVLTSSNLAKKIGGGAYSIDIKGKQFLASYTSLKSSSLLKNLAKILVFKIQGKIEHEKFDSDMLIIEIMRNYDVYEPQVVKKTPGGKLVIKLKDTSAIPMKLYEDVESELSDVFNGLQIFPSGEFEACAFYPSFDSTLDELTENIKVIARMNLFRLITSSKNLWGNCKIEVMEGKPEWMKGVT